MTTRELILGAVDDLVTSLLWYDRKEDEDLPAGVIQDAITSGEVTITDLTAQFDTALREALT